MKAWFGSSREVGHGTLQHLCNCLLVRDGVTLRDSLPERRRQYQQLPHV
jgi:hypothetical protein